MNLGTGIEIPVEVVVGKVADVDMGVEIGSISVAGDEVPSIAVVTVVVDVDA